jgi:hypothetical protein
MLAFVWAGWHTQLWWKSSSSYTHTHSTYKHRWPNRCVTPEATEQRCSRDVRRWRWLDARRGVCTACSCWSDKVQIECCWSGAKSRADPKSDTKLDLDCYLPGSLPRRRLRTAAERAPNGPFESQMQQLHWCTTALSPMSEELNLLIALAFIQYLLASFTLCTGTCGPQNRHLCICAAHWHINRREGRITSTTEWQTDRW